MPITFGDAKKVLSRYVGRGGKCPTDDEVNTFVFKTLQYMLFSGHYGNLRKFCFCAVKGCFTAPYELEVAEKVKIEGEVGSVWDKWFEWHPAKVLPQCLPADEALFEEPNYVATAYELPLGGARVGATALCTEAEDAYIIIQGKDMTGREVYTVHNGERIVGEYLKLKKGELRYTETIFGNIDKVTKPITKGYVHLYWYLPDKGTKGFLSEYTPVEEHPQYRKFRLTSRHCKPIVKVSVFGRIRLKPNYMENDYIPFENFYTLEVAGQSIQSQFNDNVQVAQAKDTTLVELISRENEFKRVNNGQPIEVSLVTAGGRIRNII